MTLPSTGTLSASQVNVELARFPGAAFSMDDPDVRRLAGQVAGPISFTNLRGKSNAPTVIPSVGNYVEDATRSPAKFTITSVSPSSGSTSTSIALQVTAIGTQTNTGNFNVTGTYNGVDYVWTVRLIATGNEIN